MTNLERWRLYMKDITSPNSFIDFGFYFMISAALQRRVWLWSEDHSPLYPNLYVIMVGEPGLGKGRVIKPVSKFLRYHKLNPASGLNKTTNTKQAQASLLNTLDPSVVKTVDPAVLQQIASSIVSINQAEQQAAAQQPIVETIGRSSTIQADEPLLLPLAAECTTFEALVGTCSKAIRRINYKAFNIDTKSEELKIYTHNSMCFVLEELSSLLRKKSEAIVNFLIVSFDCGEYKYETKHQGTDLIRRPCLSFLGGTTPGFMQKIFDDSLIDEGFASRTLFVYEYAPRFYKFGMADITEEQLQASEVILQHIRDLSCLYGEVKIAPDAMEYMRLYFEEELPRKRINTNTKLNAYYSRKNIHLPKLAMAVHFADHTDMILTLKDCQKAMDLLAYIEPNMHHALNHGGKNPLAGVAKKILGYLNSYGEQTFRDLFVEFVSEVREAELKEVINYLLFTEKIRVDMKDNMRYYSAIITL